MKVFILAGLVLYIDKMTRKYQLQQKWNANGFYNNIAEMWLYFRVILSLCASFLYSLVDSSWFWFESIVSCKLRITFQLFQTNSALAKGKVHDVISKSFLVKTITDHVVDSVTPIVIMNKKVSLTSKSKFYLKCYMFTQIVKKRFAVYLFRQQCVPLHCSMYLSSKF